MYPGKRSAKDLERLYCPLRGRKNNLWAGDSENVTLIFSFALSLYKHLWIFFESLC